MLRFETVEVVIKVPTAAAPFEVAASFSTWALAMAAHRRNEIGIDNFEPRISVVRSTSATPLMVCGSMCTRLNASVFSRRVQLLPEPPEM